MVKSGKSTERRTYAVYALTSAGAEIARKIAADLEGATLFLPGDLAVKKSGENPFDRLASAVTRNFGDFDGHVLVTAAGLAVRIIAPLIVDKSTDPGVVVLDQNGRFAVSLLSGHLGRANELAVRVAEITGGQAVITTATDSLDKPAVEVLARENGFSLENTAALSRISRDVIEGRSVTVYDTGRWFRPELSRWPDSFNMIEDLPPENPDAPLIWVGYEEWNFPPHWLVVRPNCLFLGVGCNRGTGLAEIEELVIDTFNRNGFSLKSIGLLASIEAKKNEAALIQLAEKLGRGIVFFGVDELDEVDTPNPSAQVALHVGVRSVCEAAALLAAKKGRLLVTKKKSANATLAVAVVDWTSLA